MTAKENTEPAPQESAEGQESAPADVPEGADPGPPTMDYFEKEDKPDGETR